jgi:hypothetical protein
MPNSAGGVARRALESGLHVLSVSGLLYERLLTMGFPSQDSLVSRRTTPASTKFRQQGDASYCYQQGRV